MTIKLRYDSHRTIQLGDKVRCTVTGLVGIATARAEYLNGCVQFCVQPPVDKDGKRVDGSYIDEGQLELLESSSFPLAVASSVSSSSPGGPQGSNTPSASYRG